MQKNSTRRGRPGYDLEQVLNGAVEVFLARGYDASSVEVLARHLGLSKSSIYHHVSSKEELLSMALDRALDALESVVADAQAFEGPGDARLEKVIRGAVRVLTEQLPFVTLLLRVRGNTEAERRALERRRTFDRRVAQIVEEASADGAMRSDVPPGTIARLIFGMINSIVEWYRPDGSVPADLLADEIVTIALDGIHTHASTGALDRVSDGRQRRAAGAGATSPRA